MNEQSQERDLKRRRSLERYEPSRKRRVETAQPGDANDHDNGHSRKSSQEVDRKGDLVTRRRDAGSLPRAEAEYGEEVGT